MPNAPIEVVVIRHLALRRPAPASAVGDQPSAVSDQPSAVGPATALSFPLRPVTCELTTEQQRDLGDLLDLLHCPVRRSILRALATAGPGNVKGLSARTSIAQNTLSQHLARLRTAGLAFCQRRGREIWYEVTGTRVHCQQQGGKLLLTVNARDGEVGVTLTVGGSGVKDGAQ